MEKAALRIAFTGPESSGKTTLATWLAQEYSLPLATEYARTYLLQHPSYAQADLDTMALGQTSWWPVEGFVADTEMHVFQVWSEVKYAQMSPMISQLLSAQHFDHYFLCAPDIPWEDDPLRESPHERQQLFELYDQALAAHQRSYTILRGPLKNRQKLIKDKVLSLLNA